MADPFCKFWCTTGSPDAGEIKVRTNLQSVLTFSLPLSFLYEGSFFIGHAHWMETR
jgi:hypothetical protein